MSVGIFTNKKYQPSEEEVINAIGSKFTLWQGMVNYIREKYPALEDFKFMYGSNYGWAWRFRIKKQFLTSLYPGKEGFSVQVNLGPEAIERTYQMELGEDIRQTIENAHPYPEGRWLFIRVENEQDMSDVKQLLALRVETKRLK
jgi:hypothetical protein